MLMMLCRQKVTKQSKMCGFSTTIIENSTLLYLRAMKIFLAETGTTRLQLQFQQSFLHYVPCHDATPWNWSKTAIIKISRPRAFKWGITCPNSTTRTTKPFLIDCWCCRMRVGVRAAVSIDIVQNSMSMVLYTVVFQLQNGRSCSHYTLSQKK